MLLRCDVDKLRLHRGSSGFQMRAKYLPFELRSPLRYHDSECVPILPANEITKIISIKWYNDYYFGRLTACPERIQLKHSLHTTDDQVFTVVLFYDIHKV